jgi:putative phosphoesterase
MQVALISDTHIPTRASEIPGWVEKRVQAADHTIHAGDFETSEAYTTVHEVAGGDLTAVYGNMDPGSIDLPSVATVELGGVEFVVTHGTGSIEGYERRVVRTVKEYGGAEAVGVSGHTHEVLDDTIDGVRVLNPGSATGADPAERATMLTAEVEDGDISVSHHDGE